MDVDALFRAVKLEDTKVVEKWCKSGGDVNVIDPKTFKKSTPLHWAAYTGSADVISVLLNYNADVNAQESDKRVPLHLAAFEGHYDAVDLLLKAGAQYLVRDTPGKTPCEVAIMNNHMDVARLFPNFKECEGKGTSPSPLGIAENSVLNNSNINTSLSPFKAPHRHSLELPRHQPEAIVDRYDEEPTYHRSPPRRSPPPASIQQAEPPEAFTVAAGPDAYPVEGIYTLVKGGSWEGMPVWECHQPETGRTGCVYSGTNGLWIITEDVCHMNDDSGLVTSAYKHEGLFPHEIQQWETHNGYDWVTDKTVSVSEVKPSGRSERKPVTYNPVGREKEEVKEAQRRESHKEYKEKDTYMDKDVYKDPYRDRDMHREREALKEREVLRDRDSFRDSGSYREREPYKEKEAYREPYREKARRPSGKYAPLYRLEEEEEQERVSWFNQEERSRRHLEKRAKKEMKEIIEEYGHSSPERSSTRYSDLPYRDTSAMEAAARRALMDPEGYENYLKEKERRRMERRMERRREREEYRAQRRMQRRREREEYKDMKRKKGTSRSRSKHRYTDDYRERSVGRSRSKHRYGEKERGRGASKSPARSLRSVSRSSVRSRSSYGSRRSKSRSRAGSRRRARSRSCASSDGGELTHRRPWLPPGSASSVTGKRLNYGGFTDYTTPLAGWDDSPARSRSGRSYY